MKTRNCWRQRFEGSGIGRCLLKKQRAANVEVATHSIEPKSWNWLFLGASEYSHEAGGTFRVTIEFGKEFGSREARR